MFVVSCLIFLLLFPSVAHPATPDQEYKKIQERMAEQKKKIREAQGKEVSVLGEIESVNLSLNRIDREMRRYRGDLRKTEAEIASVDGKIAETRSGLEKQKERIGKKLRTMYRFGYSGDAVTLLLNARDLSQMMRVWKYLETISVRDHEAMEDYRRGLRELDEQSARLEALKATLTERTRKVRSKEEELARKRKEKEIILSSVRDEKAEHKKMLGELQDASKRLLDLIRESARKDTYAGAGAGFGRRRGKLTWPVDGKIAIPYGSQRDPLFDTPVFRNGVQIETGPGSDARSVYGGKVIFSDWFRGFGLLVIVNHGGGYHTLYGNLSEIFSHAGDIIKENQVIGKVGTSGTLNAPGLYFEVRYRGKPLNPAQWLKTNRR